MQTPSIRSPLHPTFLPTYHYPLTHPSTHLFPLFYHSHLTSSHDPITSSVDVVPILRESRKRSGRGAPTLAPAMYLSMEDVLTEAFFMRSNFNVTATHTRFHTSEFGVESAAKACGFDP